MSSRGLRRAIINPLVNGSGDFVEHLGTQDTALLFELQSVLTPTCKQWCVQLPCNGWIGYQRAVHEIFCGACAACSNANMKPLNDEAARVPRLRSNVIGYDTREGEEAAGWLAACPPSCNAGYCDPSLGVCVCLPGWRGAVCDVVYLSACLGGSGHLRFASCAGYGGVMPCECVLSYRTAVSCTLKITLTT